MGELTSALLELTPSKLWGLVSTPSQISSKLRRPPSSTVERAVLGALDGVTREQIEEYRRQFLGDHDYFAEVNQKMVDRRLRHTRASYEELAYVLTRCLRPEVVVETGVFDGQSSAAFLLAMRDNGTGTLVSIDLPAVAEIHQSTDRMLESALPPGCGPGWLIPDELRDRHELVLGDSRQLLPAVLDERGLIDVFIHDSLHTLEHQLFEYRTAWPHLRDGGLLLSDDIHWNAAFHRFCKEVGQPYQRSLGVGICVKAS